MCKLFCFPQEYLQLFYGYRPKSDRPKRAVALNEELTTGFCDKVKEMQRFFGLTPNGNLNKETLAMMKKPRCGLSDVEPYGGTSRWIKRTVSYRWVKSSQGSALRGTANTSIPLTLTFGHSGSKLEVWPQFSKYSRRILRHFCAFSEISGQLWDSSYCEKDNFSHKEHRKFREIYLKLSIHLTLSRTLASKWSKVIFFSTLTKQSENNILK